MSKLERNRLVQHFLNEQRLEIIFLLKDMPSLKNLMDSAIMEIYADAIEWAGDETQMPQNVFPAQCPFTKEQPLDKKFYPDDSCRSSLAEA